MSADHGIGADGTVQTHPIGWPLGVREMPELLEKAVQDQAICQWGPEYQTQMLQYLAIEVTRLGELLGMIIRDRSPETAAGEPKTESATTPTCGSGGSGEKPDHKYTGVVTGVGLMYDGSEKHPNDMTPDELEAMRGAGLPVVENPADFTDSEGVTWQIRRDGFGWYKELA